MNDSYNFPPVVLLEKRPIRRLYSDPIIIALRRLITKNINDNGIGFVRIFPVVIGPAVYFFVIVLNESIDIDIIRDSLSDLNVYGQIRIVPLEDGDQYIAIEVPRHDRQKLYLRNILETKSFQNFRGRLPMALGMPTENYNLIGLPLISLGHILICGGVSTGKSMLLHSLILSLLYTQTPKELQMVLIDTKNEEFGVYNKIEDMYLYHNDCCEKGIITSDVQAVRMTYSLCEEMDRRLNLLSGNRFCEDDETSIKWQSIVMETECHLPYIVVVIDEFSEILKIFGKHFELPLCRLAQMGHKVGIHVVISTRDTSESVLSSLLTSVFSTRISFKLGSAEDSRRVLDESGAELLSGEGDMLYRSNEYIRRMQGCFVDSRHIESVCNWIMTADKEESQPHKEESKQEEEIPEGSNNRNCTDEGMEIVKNSKNLRKALKESFCMIESSSEGDDIRKPTTGKRDFISENVNSDQSVNPEIKEKDISKEWKDIIQPYINEIDFNEEGEESDQLEHEMKKEKTSFVQRIWRMISHKKNDYE